MPGILLTLLLTLQLFFSPFSASAPASLPEQPQASPLWWGMLDPEMSLWFARVPADSRTDGSVRWDWSWEGFWAALVRQPLVKEAADAPTV